MSKNPKNVVLISIDALRRDFLRIYNENVCSNTFIDQLGAKGVVFWNAITNGNWTIPSHGSILYGLKPNSHKILRWKASLPNEHKNLFDYFSEYEYLLGCFASEGVRDLLKPISQKMDFFEDSVSSNIFNFCDASKPFFIFWHFMETHAPYGIKPLRIIKEDDVDYYLAENEYNYIRYLICNGRLDIVKEAYLDQIRNVASKIESFVKALKESGKSDNTIFVITSDHGEVWEPYKPFHCHFSEDVLRIPLVIFHKGLAHEIVHHLVSQIDIAPTILDLCGYSHPSHALEGKSLVPLLRGRQLKKTPVLIMGPNGFRNEDPYVAVRDEKYILICNIVTGEEELYDVEKDPAYKTNLLNYILDEETQRILHEFRKIILVAKRDTTSERDKDLDKELETPDEIINRLKALGYI